MKYLRSYRLLPTLKLHLMDSNKVHAPINQGRGGCNPSKVWAVILFCKVQDWQSSTFNVFRYIFISKHVHSLRLQGGWLRTSLNLLLLNNIFRTLTHQIFEDFMSILLMISRITGCHKISGLAKHESCACVLGLCYQ